MKIGIIVRILWPGGVQRIAIAEAEGLTRLGNDVELIFIRRTIIPIFMLDLLLLNISHLYSLLSYKELRLFLLILFRHSFELKYCTNEYKLSVHY